MTRASATFGIEEEFMLLDPESLRPVPVGAAVLERLRPRWGGLAKKEFLAAQVEHASAVFTSLSDADEALAAFRSDLAEAAAESGALATGLGMPFDASPDIEISPDARYERVRADVRGLLDQHRVSGLHVHVAVPDREHGVAVLNRVRVWLPVLVALAADSPFWQGRDTGFESWRTIVMRRWMTHGCPPPFVDAADYARRVGALVGVGATTDEALVSWTLRLSQHLGTIEFRAADAQLSRRDSLAIAALCRALVRRASDEVDAGASDVVPVAPELLDAATWTAARDGHHALLPQPGSGELRAVPEVVSALREYVGDHLTDGALLVDRLIDVGSGAQRARAARDADGVAGLRRLLARELTC